MPTRALRTAASGMYAQELNIEAISNNIANISTTAFKKNKAQFQDLMYQQVNVAPINTDKSSTAVSGNTLQIGNGVQPTSTEKILLLVKTVLLKPVPAISRLSRDMLKNRM